MAQTVVQNVESMDLEAFAQAGLVVRVWSTVLEREVLFVSDNVPTRLLPADGPAIFRAAELRKLAPLRPSPRALQAIHDIKAIFNGEVSEVRDAPQTNHREGNDHAD